MNSMMRLVGSIKNLECQMAFGCVAAVLVGVCLSTPAIAIAPESGVEKSESVEVLSDLRVESGASGTRMILEGVRTTDYSMKESPDGDSWTIELANVRESRSEDWEGEKKTLATLESQTDGNIHHS